MNPIAEIVKKLGNRPSIAPILEEDSIYVEPQNENGFAVSIIAAGKSEHIVAFDRWHEHFSEPAEAVECFAFGLFGHC